jgi:ABC-type transporter Mla subunit MlaD
MEDSIPAALAALTGYTGAAKEPVEEQEPTTTQAEAPASEVDAAIDKIAEVLDGFKASLSALEEALENLRQSMGGQE